MLPEVSKPSLTIEQDDRKDWMSASNEFKSDYIRQFDDINRGLADSYSAAKGGVLLKMNAPYSNPRVEGRDRPEVTHYHDFRSVWVPKKFEGRNMFASHIKGAIFPENNE